MKNLFGATLALLVTFLSALILVCAIPSSSVNAQLSNTISTLKKEGTYPSVGLSWRKIVLDNFTDGVMLNIAYSVDSNDPIKSAIRNIQHDGDKDSADQIANLEKLYLQKDVHETIYERYWHGYLIFLRPLLAITSYDGVRFALTALLFTVSTAFLFASWKKLGARITLCMFVALLAVDFFWLGKSLQLSNTFFTGMFGSLYVLSRKKLSFEEMCITFFVVGAATSFIDVLSAPLVSLGFLLAIVMGLLKTLDLKKLLLLCMIWSCGYLSLWGAKWIIAEYTYVPGAIQVGYKKVQDRTMNVVDAEFSRPTAVLRNFYQLRGYDKRNKIVLLVLGVSYFLFIARYFSIKSANKKQVGLWIAIATIPYVWYFIAAEHSYIHVLFTYRNQFMTVVAAFMATTEFVDWERVKKDVRRFPIKIPANLD